MRVLLSTLAIGFGGAALATPCGPVPPSEIKTVDSWKAVYEYITSKGGSAYKDDAQASEYICAAKPCGPAEPMSLVAEVTGIGAAVVFKNPTGYTVLTLPVALPPNVFEADLTRLRPDVVHVSVDYEELGREMWCEDEDRDKNGDCVDGRTATVGLGWNDHDLLINPISRSITWSKACSVGEDDDHRDSRVRLDGQHFGYESCAPKDRTAWFQLKGGKCVASAPYDVTALLKSARKLARSGDYAGAIALFDTLVKAEPGDGGILGERGYLKHKAGDATGAMGDLDAALKLRPAQKVRGSIQYNRGLVLLGRGDPKAALDAFVDADRLRPSKAAKAKIEATKALLVQ